MKERNITVKKHAGPTAITDSTIIEIDTFRTDVFEGKPRAWTDRCRVAFVTNPGRVGKPEHAERKTEAIMLTYKEIDSDTGCEFDEECLYGTLHLPLYKKMTDDEYESAVIKSLISDLENIENGIITDELISEDDNDYLN